MASFDLTMAPGLHPAAAQALAAVDLSRPRLVETVKDLSPEQLSKVPAGLSNTIATLIVHVAGTEVRMALLLNQESLPDDLAQEFLLIQPYNPLPVAEGETADSLIAKLAKSRSILGDAMSRLTEADLTREVPFGQGRMFTVRRLLAMVSNHQSLHCGHIQMIRKLI